MIVCFANFFSPCFLSKLKSLSYSPFSCSRIIRQSPLSIGIAFPVEMVRENTGWGIRGSFWFLVDEKQLTGTWSSRRSACCEHISFSFPERWIACFGEVVWIVDRREWTARGWNARERCKEYIRMAHHGKRLIIRSLRATYVLAFLFAFSLLYFVVENGLLTWIIQNALSISGVSPNSFCFMPYVRSYRFVS